MNAIMSFMFWKDWQNVPKSENKSIQQNWNVILQRPEYVAALRWSNLQQNIDLKETESISYHTLRVFVTVWLFFIICGPVEEPHWRDVVSLLSCRRGKLQRMSSPDFGAYWHCTAALKKFLHWINISFLNQINIIFFSYNRIECSRGGGEAKHLRSVPYSLRIS